MSVYLELYGEYPHLVIVDNLGDARDPAGPHCGRAIGCAPAPGSTS